MARKKRSEVDQSEEPVPRKAHNGPTPTELQEWLTEMTEADTAMSRIRARVANLKKTVESDGGNWRALKLLFRSSKLSEAEAQQELEDVVAYHRSLNIKVSFDPLNGQGTMDDLMEPSPESTAAAADKLANARAHGDGYNSGARGAAPSDNPHEPGTEPHVYWHKGRDDGQLDRELKMGVHPEQAEI